MVLFMKHEDGKILLEKNINLVNKMVNKLFENEHNSIWGFQKTFIKSSENNRIYLYFKICFNVTSNLWQFCINNYDRDSYNDEIYLSD